MVTGLIGRQAETVVLGRFLAATAAGEGSTTLIRGVAGSGKTALLRHLVREAARRSFAVLRVNGVEGSEPFGLQAANELLAATNAAFATGGSNDLAASESLDSPTSLARHLAARLLRLATNGPVLVALDDCHWFDASSSEAFVRLAQLVYGEPVAFVAASRPPEPGVRPPSLAAAAHETIELAPLSEDDGRLLLQLDGPIATDVASACWTIAAGNPLALRSIRLTERQRNGTEPLEPGVLSSAARLDETFAEMFDALEPQSRRTVALLAISTLEPGLLSAASSLGAPPTIAVEKLVDPTTGGLRHPLMRPAVLSRLTAAERRWLHGSIADALASAIQNGLGNDAVRLTEQRAWHRAQSVDGRHEAVAEEVAKVALSVRLRGAVAEARLLFERSAALHPDPDRRASLLVDAADAAWLLSDPRWTAELLDAADSLGSFDHHVVARSSELRAHVRMWTEGPLPALAILDSAVERVAPHLPEQAVSLLAVATVFAEMVPDTERQLRYAAQAEGIAAASPGFATIAAQFAVASASVAAGDTVRATAAYAQLDPVVAMLIEMSSPEFEHVLGAYGALHTLRERYGEARLLVERLLARADRHDALAQSVLLTGTLAHVEWFSGDWLRALALSRRYSERHPLGPVADALGRSFLGVIEASLGLADEARATIAPVVELIGAGGARAPLAAAGWAEGLIALAGDDDAGAVAALAPAVAITTHGGLASPMSSWWVADYAEALWGLGRTADASDVLTELVRRSGSPASGSTAAMVARLTGLLASDGEVATPAFALSVRLADDGGMPFASARSQLAEARWRLRQGDSSGAAEVARRARATFERLGAAGFANRADAFVGAAGMPKLFDGGAQSAGAASARSAKLALLSPAELRVVEVIVRGVTMKQAAEELIISAKTVDAHLQQVYRKLAIRSRAELATLFARERS